MRDEADVRLDARIWIRRDDGLVLVGERRRLRDGRLAMTWHVAPEAIRDILWVEILGGEAEEVSAE